jgi:glycosyltransferase involved in cell wall biosynthesis
VNALGIEHDRPEELNEVSCPVIGYVGNLVTMRLDIELLEYVTKMRSDLFWVFVGPMDNQFANSSMHKLKNVCFTGLKKQNVLSAYVMHFDVCLNPQLLNELTIGNYPRKLDEYLSFGKPVLARKTEATSEFSKYIYEYTNMNEFLILLDEALNEETNAHIREERKFFAGMHTWENTVQKILMELDNTNN